MLLVAPEGTLGVGTFVCRSLQQLLFVARRPQESPLASYCTYVFVVKSFCRFMKPVDVRSFQRFYGITARFTVTWGCSLPLPNSCALGLRPAYPLVIAGRSQCCHIITLRSSHLSRICSCGVFCFSQPVGHTYNQTAEAMAGSRSLPFLLFFFVLPVVLGSLSLGVSAWKLLAVVATRFISATGSFWRPPEVSRKRLLAVKGCYFFQYQELLAIRTRSQLAGRVLPRLPERVQ